MIKLSQWVRLLNEQSVQPVSYNRALFAVMAGVFPAEQRFTRWFVDPAAIPTAVEYFANRKMPNV